ncbi:Vacuolar protein-sorting-associated protein 27 [Podila epigama]|nr:Vacuolar protein-sorting-associated protein 27 [Podila epigama]
MDWFKSTTGIDELIDKATSENLPSGTEDLALNLEICDQIRSKQVSPKDAAKALKRRISHKNPNVQLLALGLTDVCVKNGGQHFLVEIASREFMDNLASILKAPAGINPEVKTRLLGLIQTWGNLFRGKRGLGYVCDTYMILQHEGYEFPPIDHIGAALVETEAPPDWTDSDVCTRCRSAFTLTNRKHHCRACGSTFCGQCSSKTMALPHLGVTQEVRVCDGCWMKKKIGKQGAQSYHGVGGAPEIVPSQSKPTQSSTGPTTTSGSSAENEDEDLKRAIELSLKEANSRPGYSAPSAKNNDAVKPPTTTSHDEEDADLLAAIEASLKDTKISAVSSSGASGSSQGQRPSAYDTYTFSVPQQEISAPASNELTETEKTNIDLFSSLVDRIQQVNGDVAGNREVQALYEQISKLQTKLALAIEDLTRKQQEVIEFNQKIDQSVQMYDRLLQERLNLSYERRQAGNSYGQPLSMYNATSPHQNTQHVSAYASDSRYGAYVPGAPFAPTLPETSQPSYQTLQGGSSFHYQPISTAQPFATAPSATAPITGHDMATAPYAPVAPTMPNHSQNHYGYQTSTTPLTSSGPFYSGQQPVSAPTMSNAPPLGGVQQQFPGQFQAPAQPLDPGQPYPQQVFAPASTAAMSVPPQAPTPTVPLQPVEDEKPLIEL